MSRPRCPRREISPKVAGPCIHDRSEHDRCLLCGGLRRKGMLHTARNGPELLARIERLERARARAPLSDDEIKAAIEIWYWRGRLTGVLLGHADKLRLESQILAGLDRITDRAARVHREMQAALTGVPLLGESLDELDELGQGDELEGDLCSNCGQLIGADLRCSAGCAGEADLPPRGGAH
jgi:hypothetical protein